MEKYTSYCILPFCIAALCFLSACPLNSSKLMESIPDEVAARSNENALLFFNNPVFIATEYSELSGKKNEVLSGKHSLKGESTADELHAVLLYTDKTKLPLKPGKTYSVSFDYRILKKGKSGFEVLFYSPEAASKNEWLDSLLLYPENALEGRTRLRCTLKKFDDYMIYWSIVEGGSIVIDNITVIEEDTNTTVFTVDIEAEEFVVDVNRKTIAEKVVNKSTVPVFDPWGPCKYGDLYDTGENPYSLIWTRRGLAQDIESTEAVISGMETYRMQRDTDTLYLIAPDWHIWVPSRQELSKRSAFYLDEFFKPHTASEYPTSLVINFEHRDWTLLMAEKAFNYKNAGFDGLLFDWWNNDAGNGRNKKRVENARLHLLKTVRKKIGDDFILMGNVNWNTNDPSARYLSGIFAELWKPSASKTYPLTYEDEVPADGTFSVARLEDFLLHWDSVLQWPKIIAVEAWKLSDKTYVLEDFAEYKNYETAKLLAAMTCVIPENGYFLYADNNYDRDDSAHDHVYYDFYRTDFGKSLSGMIKIAEGAAYKEYERGYIAYNRTASAISFYTEDGRYISLHPREGIFVAK
ncbi:hypothetical protein V1L52_05345 [Treponema sp. HNW]|uniref:hypothetical protein n=1 Tax=Treponema sp. HNW TaxID=3116654 RepID=UPI003D1068A6